MRHLAVALACLSASLAQAAGPFHPRASHVWPVSGTAVASLPFSSSFGPRLKASASYRYDWHRGVDIPLACNTPLRAIRAGVVRMAGDYPGTYSDRMVQICHPRPGAPADVCGRDDNGDGRYDDANGDGRVDSSVSTQAYYSVYLHLATTSVQVGQVVAAGDVVATSGDSDIFYSGVCQPDDPGGFDHLHFEIRDGGVNQMHAVHPLLVLPFTDASAPAVTISGANLTNPLAPVIGTTITAATGETDFNRVEAAVFDHTSGTPQQIDSHVFDINEWNLKYSGEVATLDTAPAYNGVYSDAAVFGADAGVTVAPAVFSNDSAQYSTTITFTSLSGIADTSKLSVRVRAVDLAGNTGTATFGAAVLVSPGAGLTTSESGGTASLSLRLNAPPSANVSLTLSSSRPAEGTVSPGTVTFTPQNWDQAQSVTITGVDDALLDGAQAYAVITSSTTSADPSFHGLAVPDPAVTNGDDEAPLAVVATATGVSTVGVTWAALPGASAYQVLRSADGTSYSVRGTTATTSFVDTGLAAGTAYLYAVRASAPVVSLQSRADLATTVSFTDAPLVVQGTPVRAVHVSELRTAVNAVRALAGLGQAEFTDPVITGSTPIRAAHVVELRSALNAARNTLALALVTPANAVLTPGVTPVRAADLEELRDGVR